VTLRDGNIGLGAVRPGRAGDETFGLEVLSGVLGRLNGRSKETLKKESDARRDARLSTWQVRKWGGKGFVSGGFLVTETIEDDSPALQSTNNEEKDTRKMDPNSSNSTDMEEDTRNRVGEDESSQSEHVSERKRLKLEKQARKKARRSRREKKGQRSEKRLQDITSPKAANEISDRSAPLLSSSNDSDPNSGSVSATPLTASMKSQILFRRRPGTRRADRPDQQALNEASHPLLLNIFRLLTVGKIFMIKSKG